MSAAEEQRAVGALRGPVLADGLAGRRDVVVVERGLRATSRGARRCRTRPAGPGRPDRGAGRGTRRAAPRRRRGPRDGRGCRHGGRSTSILHRAAGRGQATPCHPGPPAGSGCPQFRFVPADLAQRVDNRPTRRPCGTVRSGPGPSLSAMTERAGVLHVHRAERADALVDGARRRARRARCRTRSPPRWSRCRPAASSAGWPSGCRTGWAPAAGHGDGVCANVAFPSPSRLVDGAGRRGDRVGPGDDPWRPERLVWPLLEVIDECAGEPWCAPLAAHLGDGRRRRRGAGSARARRLAELFASYARAPPAAAARLAAGADGRRPLTGDLAGSRAVAAAARAASAGRIRPSGWPPPAPRCAPTRSGRAAGAAVALRAHPAAGRRSWPCWPRWPSTATCTCGCRTPPPRCGRGWPRPPRRSVPRRDADPTAGPAATRCCPRSAATSASCSCGWPPRPRTPSPAPPATGSGRRPCSAGCSGDCATTSRRTGRGRSPAARPQRAGARLPRPAPPGRGAARGAARAAGRRPDPRAARRAGDVPGRRDVRPAGLGRLRARWPGDRAAPRAPAAGAAGRPRAAPDQPAARHRGHAARAGRRPGHRVAGARPAGLRPGAAAVPARRRRPRAAARPWTAVSGVRWGLDAAHRGPVPAAATTGRTPGRAGLDRLLLAVTMSPGSGARTRTGRRGWLGTALPMDDVDSGDIDLARPARRVRRPAGRGARRAVRGATARRLDRRPDQCTRPAHRHHGRPGLGGRPGQRPSSPRPPGPPVRTPTPSRWGWPTCAPCWPTGCAGGPAGPASAPAR